MFLIYQFILLLLFFLLISIYIEKSFIKKIFAFISSLLLTLELISAVMFNKLFGPDFINNINLQYGLNSIQNILILLSITTMLTPIFYFLSKKLVTKLEKVKTFTKISIFLLIILLVLKKSIFYEIAHIWIDTSNKIIISTEKSINKIDLNNYMLDTSRFIAHGGGEIGGHKYTESLEAINNSYSKGFRMFELDIHKTKDNVYVAVHDWERWTLQTNYKGTLPPNHRTFLQYKIYNKYSPLDIYKINEWFKNHPDAILVTDKVNTPLDFSNKFIDKSRLIMELFSWKAVLEGLNAHIKSAMPTFGILKEIKGNKIDFLMKNKIKNIASSRQKSENYKIFLLNLKNIGIETYAFHINDTKKIDELYLICQERDYFYGLYADKWDFNASHICKNKRINNEKNHTE